MNRTKQLITATWHLKTKAKNEKLEDHFKGTPT